MSDTKIYLVTFVGMGPLGERTLVSHGVGNNTLSNHCLPPDPVSFFNPKYDGVGPYIDCSEEVQ